MGSERQDRLISEQRRKLYFTVLFILLIVVSPFLLAFSYAVINPGEMALLWNKNLHNVDLGKLYMEGRYFVGLGREFIKFPSYAVDVGQEYISCRTKDGLGVMIQPS